jgi:hypothetical protein
MGIFFNNSLRKRILLICRFCNWKVKKLYLYEEEKSQKQRGQHLYYRRSHKVSTIHHQRTKYTEKSKKKLIPSGHYKNAQEYIIVECLLFFFTNVRQITGWDH